MLQTWEERFSSLTRRVVMLDLELPRLWGYIKTGEGLQDRLNSSVAERLAALEAKTSDL